MYALSVYSAQAKLFYYSSIQVSVEIHTLHSTVFCHISRLFTRTSNHKAGGQPLVGNPRRFWTHLHVSVSEGRPFRPETEDAPYCGGRWHTFSSQCPIFKFVCLHWCLYVLSCIFSISFHYSQFFFVTCFSYWLLTKNGADFLSIFRTCMGVQLYIALLLYNGL